jgi:prolyl oligopeptidase
MSSVPRSSEGPYPEAARLDVTEQIHGQPVSDPYRWLEDPSDPRTVAWSEAQDDLVHRHLDRLPGKQWFRSRLFDLMRPGLVTAPVVRQGRSFFQRRSGDQEHAVLLVREPGGSERVLVDPGALSEDGIVTLDAWSPSWDGRRLAYLLSEGGDEESVLRVMEVDTGEVIDGPIDRTRYSSVAWLPGSETFYYVRRLPPEIVPEGESQFHRRVYRHILGTDAESDEPLFGQGRNKLEYYELDVSSDGRWLLVWASVGTAPRTDVYLADLEVGFDLRIVQEGLDAVTTGFVRADDGLLYLHTNLAAPRYRVAVTDPERPEPEHWRDLVPESDAVIEGFAVTTDAVVVASTRHAVSAVTVHDRQTGAVRDRVQLPPLGHVDGVSSAPEGGNDAWIAYTDFVTPPRVYRCDVRDGSVGVWQDAPGRGAADPNMVRVEQVSYPSKDGTQIRMFILHRPDVVTTGGRSQPTILYGYGGFDVSVNPAYAPAVLAWVAAGGVYAIANLRGGSEEGEAWHRAGMREHKQNVFDDFIGAAEWLVARGWTAGPRLGIYGGSNGGLLVGAAVTQRPDLFEAVVCSAPLLDMVRYERFGLGETWNDEYGTLADPVEASWLLAYSPYHHVVTGVSYPAVLFTVFESDTRVDPLHGRKMCAALQAATSSDRPVLIRREVNVGHSARSVSREVDLAVDRLAFMADRLGLSVPEN